MIPTEPLNLYSSQYSAIVFMVAALIFFIIVLWAGWSLRRGGVHVLVGISLISILLGLCVAMSYEAAAVWCHDQTALPTISHLANNAFGSHRSAWGVVFLLVILIGGMLTMNFTMVVQATQQTPNAPNPPQLPVLPQQDWALLITVPLFVLNGAVLAYWFNWLP